MNAKSWLLFAYLFAAIMIITNLFYGNIIEANGERRGYRHARGCEMQDNPLYMRQGYHHCNCPFWRRV